MGLTRFLDFNIKINQKTGSKTMKAILLNVEIDPRYLRMYFFMYFRRLLASLTGKLIPQTNFYSGAVISLLKIIPRQE